MKYTGLQISHLLGKTLKSVSATEETIDFETDDGKKFQMYHPQDCCENVYVESITGDLQDLVGHPLLVVEEISNYEPKDAAAVKAQDVEESFTWTFYKLATVKGWVDIRWFGASNGYYGESVDFAEVLP